ncbi:protein CHUP1, chloroplastic-like [Gastrolobium bilobum]|uniref:protein CHUP1, chloroplastic-like n=1 Tax=Gastrolobium bilobum TaxID=150636 RepID=UPI002AB1DC2F|nr:protein CHUP1, chloroplastic-like [Gastrolobium bilobum]
MENTTLKVVILKAGVPLAATLAGLIYAWIMAKKSLSKASSLSKNEVDSSETNCHQGTKHEESFHNLSSIEVEEHDSAMDSSVLSGSLVIHDNHPCLEQEISGLRSQIEGMQMRELALSLKFEQYCEMREQESLLMEMKNIMSLETARVEFLDREVSSIERETVMFENFVVQYLGIIEQLEYWKSENRVLQKKVQKLLRKSKAQSGLIKEQALKTKAQEEILRNHDALQTRISVINKLEDEIRELQRVLDQLQDEKNELLKKLDTAEKAYESKVCKEHIHRKPLKYYLQVESGGVGKEDYDKLLNELEHVKKERAAEVEELIHLRRTNACLRHELMSHQEQQQDQYSDHIELEFEGSRRVMHYDSEHELHYSFMGHQNVPCFGSADRDGAGSKRKNLLKRLKRWVEGSEKVRVKSEEKKCDEIRCLDMHSVSYGSMEPEVPETARFCSSA